MRNILLRLTVLIFLLSLPHSVYGGTGIDYDDANCQGAWLFTEGSGTSVADSSQNSNAGDFFRGSGEPSWTSTVPAAYVDYSVLFDHDDDTIRMGDITVVDGSPSLSITFWTFPTTIATNDRWVTKWGAATVNRSFQVAVDSGANDEIRFALGNGAGQLLIRDTTNANLSTGNWYHVACTFTANQTIVVYVDGVAKSLASVLSTNITGIYNSNTNFELGQETNEAEEPVEGNMTEASLWDDVLTLTEVNDIMDNGLAPVGAPTGYGQVIGIMIR